MGCVFGLMMHLINFYKLLSRARAWFGDVGLVLGPVMYAYDFVTLAG